MLCLYVRVSSVDQTIELQEKQAREMGFVVDEIVADEGVSGVSTILAERPEGRRLFDMLRAGDLLIRWVDRLGRNYSDVTDTIRKFMKKGVIIKTMVNSMVFDGSTKDPMQRAVRDSLLSFMAAMAEMEIVARKEAQKVGIAHARESDLAYIGRKPSYDRKQLDTVRGLLSKRTRISEIERATGLSRLTIYRKALPPQPGPCLVPLAWARVPRPGRRPYRRLV